MRRRTGPVGAPQRQWPVKGTPDRDCRPSGRIIDVRVMAHRVSCDRAIISVGASPDPRPLSALSFRSADGVGHSGAAHASGREAGPKLRVLCRTRGQCRGWGSDVGLGPPWAKPLAGTLRCGIRNPPKTKGHRRLVQRVTTASRRI